jgi:hypothetical protein
MDRDASTHTPPGGTSARIARRTGTDTGSMTSVATLLPPPPPPPGPTTVVQVVPAGPFQGATEAQRRILLVVLAAAVVLALVATVGLAVMWSGNRKLAAEVEAATAQATLATERADAVEAGLEGFATAETVDGLAGRVQGVEDWTGLPADADRELDLQTRMVTVMRSLDTLEDDVHDGLGTVRRDLSAVEGELANTDGSVTPQEVETLRQELEILRTALEGVRQDVGVLCWSLTARPDLGATC